MRLAGFLIVFGCLFVGQVIIWLTKLPLPPSIIGLLLLFGLLQSRLVKIEQVQSLARVLLDYLAFLIVPACISLMQYFEVIKMDFWAIIGATVFGTLLVLFATAHSYQIVRRLIKQSNASTNIKE
ncbi:MAG: CidA/LrgA family protein [Moraxella sp.]|nr:CidA/LrgA family protein [Moraxella sp.]